MKYSKHPVVNMYLIYLNDFVTVSRFAEHLEVSEGLAALIIKEGRELHALYNGAL